MTKHIHNAFLHILTIAFVGMFCYACKNDIKEIESLVDFANKPLETSENVEMAYSDGGVVQMKMFAPVLERFALDDGDKLNWPNGIRVLFYDSINVVKSELIAKTAHLIESEKYMLVRDSVVFSNIKHEKLETEELQLFFDKDSIYTDKFVKITTKDGVIIGKKLISNINFTKYRILNITDSYYNIDVADDETDNTPQNDTKTE